MSPLQTVSILISMYIATCNTQGGISGFGSGGGTSSSVDNCNYIETLYTAYYYAPLESDDTFEIYVYSGEVMPTGVCISSESQGVQGVYMSTFLG